MLIKGSLWRIRDGKQAKVGIDQWILRYHVLQPLNEMVLEDYLNTTVSSLIDYNTKWWDINMVRVSFDPIVAVEILKIVIGSILRN